MTRDADPGDVARVLGGVARLGPYFEIVTAPGQVAGEAWTPLADPGRLRAVTSEHAERLGTGERRVAASLLFQGLASRLWSPAVAAAARGVVPDLAGLRWRWAPGEPIAFGLARVRGWRVDGAGAAAEIIFPMVVDGHLRPLRDALLAFAGLADGLLWGNAASALAGSLAVGPPGDGRADLVRALLAREPLAGAGSLGPRGYARRSCCLYYRVPGGGLCADCALVSRDSR